MRAGQAKVLTDSELIRVYSIAGSLRFPERDTVLLDFSFRLGLRVKEMSALMISDIVEGNGKIRNEFHLTADQAKGDKGRTVYLTNKRLRKNLQIYLDSREGDLNLQIGRAHV